MQCFWQRHSIVYICIAVALGFLLCSAWKGPKGKISPGLLRILERCEASQDFNSELPVIIQSDPDCYHLHGVAPGLVEARQLKLVHGHAGWRSSTGRTASSN